MPESEDTRQRGNGQGSETPTSSNVLSSGNIQMGVRGEEHVQLPDTIY